MSSCQRPGQHSGANLLMSGVEWLAPRNLRFSSFLFGMIKDHRCALALLHTNRGSKMIRCLSALLLLSWMGVTAQEEKSEPKGGEPGWKPPQKQAFLKARSKRMPEIQKSIHWLLWENSWLNLVRELDKEQIKKVMKRGVRITEVEASTIAMIPPGQDQCCSNESQLQAVKWQVCSVRWWWYVLHSWVKKRLFPDWDSYQEHSKKRRVKRCMSYPVLNFKS